MSEDKRFDPNTPFYEEKLSANLTGENYESVQSFASQFSQSQFPNFHKKTLPRKLIIESINLCNASCVFCAYQYKTEKAYNLDLETLDLATQKYVAFHPDSFISLTPSFGDPLIDLDIFKKVAVCKKNGIKRVQFYTNAILLEKRLDELLASQLDTLNISIGDFDREEYEQIYRVKKYDQVLRGIHLLVKTVKEKNITLPIHIKLRSRRKLEEILNSPDYLTYIAPFESKYLHVSGTDEYDNWGGMIKPSDLPEGMKMSESRHHQKSLPCRRLYDIQLLPDGGIRLCGARRNPDNIYDDLVIGNIKTHSFDEIWTSEKFLKIADGFFTDQVPELCKDCSFYEAVGADDRRTVLLKK